MEGALSCGKLPARKKPTEIDALSDEILLIILEQANKRQGHIVLRATLPLVCERWREATYGAKGGALIRCIVLDYNSEDNLARNGHWPLGSGSLGIDQSHFARWRGGCSETCKAGISNIPASYKHGNVAHNPNAVARQQKPAAGSMLAICALMLNTLTGLLRDLKFSFLWAVPNLRQLSLENVAHHIHQEDFKRGIACLRHLEEFRISGHGSDSPGLTSFPTALCSLEHLTALSFTDQHLGRLPREVSQLGKLADLHIEDGSIEHIEKGHLPSVLGRLTALRSLALIRCLEAQAETGSSLETCSWQSMTQLTHLTLTEGHGGPEGHLPPEVGDLCGLIELDLEDVDELCDQLQLTTLRQLGSICITETGMAQLPAWMGAFPNLTFLSVDQGELEAWPTAKFKSLQSIDISWCKVAKVPDNISQLTCLTLLILLGCPIEELSSSISCLQNLRHLALDTSYIQEFPSGLQALRAPQLQSVCLEGRNHPTQQSLDAKNGEKSWSMPVNAANLAWLLHSPRLGYVSISASKAEAAALRRFKKEMSRVCGHDVLRIHCL